MLVHEVFDKVLYLTPSARAQFSSGRIFNLVTTDAETLQMLFQNILGVISSPARIIGSMAMLYVQLGPSSLVALAVLILMMPAQVTRLSGCHCLRHQCRHGAGWPLLDNMFELCCALKGCSDTTAVKSQGQIREATQCRVITFA